MNYQKKSITIDGQIIAMIDASGKLRYNKYEDVDEEVQRLMKKWLTRAKTLTTRQLVTKTKREKEEVEAVQDEATATSKADVEGSSSSSKNSPLIQQEEIHEKTTFIVLQKNTRSMNSSERLEELFRKVHRVR